MIWQAFFKPAAVRLIYSALLFSFWFDAGCSGTGNTGQTGTITSQPGTASPGLRVGLEQLGPAPELQNEVWLNTDAPLRLADLRGQVVLLDMWTFG